ncbi:MAG: hypothetical protein COA67_05685 [Lutibacter sp.]|nr:MAG: hypothetical protein COA67_05685 [Lutibacter sp.]
MKKIFLTFIICACSVLLCNSQKKKEKVKGCATITHKVEPVDFCKTSTATSVILTLELNCEIKDGVNVRIEFFGKNKKWNHIKTETLKTGTGIIKYRGTGLEVGTNQAYRILVYPKKDNFYDFKYPSEKYEEHSFFVERICD